MLTVRNTRVVSFSREYLDITWEIAPTNEDVQAYEFYVERSEAEAGPFETIAGPLIDQYFVRDNTVLTISVTRVYFYRVRVKHVPTAREIVTPVFDRYGDPDLLAVEMIRREQLLWQEFAGTKFWLFPRRTFGQRCAQSYDTILGKRNQDACPTCFNTTFAGGYHHPIEFWGQIDNPEDAEQVSIEDHRQQRYFVMRCGPSPDIKPLDLIVDSFNRRHRVVSRGGTSKHGVGVRQEIRLVEVQRGSIEDKVPLNVDHTQTTWVPGRNFTNPHNLEETGEEVDLAKILGPYGY
jgi:hypothetical protein